MTNNAQQDDRKYFYCKMTGKLLGKIDQSSLEQLAQVPGGLWSWCRNCHREHYFPWKDIAGKR